VVPLHSPDPDAMAPDSFKPFAEQSNEVVQTFSFDVSAGVAAKAVASAEEKEEKKNTVAQPVAIEQAEVTFSAGSIQQKKTATLGQRGRRRVPSWTTSLALHGAVILLLSLYALPGLQKNEDFGLLASAAPVEEEVGEFQEIEIDSMEALESIDLAPEIFDPGAAALGELSIESTLFNASDNETTLPSDSLGDLGALFGESGSGLTDLSIGTSEGDTASFFGAKVQGKRILYMIDNSGSMQNGRMETVLLELRKSVESLDANQQFYVIFYSDTVYGLGHPQPAHGFLPANKQNKQRLQQWLETVELCGGNAIDEAIVAAETVNPDVVFMVSDGWVRTTKSGRKYKLLLNSVGRRFTLHTLGMGCKKAEHRAQLLAIAEAHGGTFQEVEVQPAMVELARQNPRPYRSIKNGGGSVWGTSFDKAK